MSDLDKELDEILSAWGDEIIDKRQAAAYQKAKQAIKKLINEARKEEPQE